MTVMEALGAGPIEPTRRRAPLIIIVGADKGGVGKTMVTRALMDYIAAQRQAVRAFDTEPVETGGVLKRFFPVETKMLQAETVGGQMEVIDSAKGDAITVVDARAGLLTPMLKAFHRIDLLSDVKSGALNLLLLHVVGSSVASSSEVRPIIEQMRGASLIRVNNKIANDSKFSPDEPGEVTITIPNLEEDAWVACDQDNASFAAFAADASQSRVLRGYVRAWLRDAHAAFDRGGIGSLIQAV